MKRSTYDRKLKALVVGELRRTFPVFVVVRHTVSGDKRVGVYDDTGTAEARASALGVAERVADEAAANYGRGSSSVFRGVLTLKGRALRPKAT